MRFIGEYIQNFTARFRGDVYVDGNVGIGTNSPDDKLVKFAHIQELVKTTGVELLQISGPHINPIISDDIMNRLKEKYNI